MFAALRRITFLISSSCALGGVGAPACGPSAAAAGSWPANEPVNGPVNGAGDSEEPHWSDAVEDAVAERDWQTARDLLAELLDGRVPVCELLRERARLVRDLERVHFWVGRERPTIQDLLDVEVDLFRPSDGRLRLRFENSELPGFVRGIEGLPDVGRYPPHKLLPIPFIDRLEVSVQGDPYPPRDSKHFPMLYVGCDPSGFTLVSFGNGQAYFESGQRRGTSGIARYTQSGILERVQVEALDSALESAIRPDGPFRLTVTVDGERIKVASNGKKQLDGRAQQPVQGYFGVGRLDFDRLQIDGRVDLDWLRLELDRRLQRDWVDFRKYFDADKYLPAGLRRADLVDDSEPRPGWERAWWPGDRDLREAELFLELSVLLASGDSAQARARLAAVDVSEVDEEFRAYLAGWVALQEGREDDALVAWDSILAGGFALGPAASQRAKLLAGSLRFDDAQRAFGALHESARESESDRAWALAERAAHALRFGRTEAAGAYIGRAAAEGRYGARIDAVARTLVLSRRGPDWELVHEAESEHFHVVSNLDRRSCVEAAERLEVGLERFSKALVPVELPQGRRFRVYLFAGRSGYEEYLAEVAGVRIENTAGVYSRPLRQLLIWRTSDQEATLATVRHEGFHQYMHLITDQAPTWLNEGLAEYWELADFTKSASRMIPDRPDYWQVTARSSLSFDQFTRLNHGAFYALQQLSYPQAWASVYYLLHSGREQRAIFDRLIAELAAGASAAQAHDAAFAGVDMQAFDVGFRRFIRERVE